MNDEVGADIVCDAWSGFPAGNIRVTGYPALDRFADYDITQSAAKTREKLGLGEAKPVVLFGGQVSRGGEMLSEVLATLNDIGKSVYLLPYRHPRMADDAPEQVKVWESALSGFKSGVVIAGLSVCEKDSFIAAADVVVSAFSTILVEASVLRKQNISVLYPDIGMAEFIRETGGGMTESPIVSLGCSSKAEDRNGLRGLLEASLAGDLRKAQTILQERFFLLDGKNAERVAKLACSFI